MKAKVATYSLKGKANIWWEYLNNFRGITEEGLFWNDFESLFREKYLSDNHENNKAKEFYELKMEQISDE